MSVSSVSRNCSNVSAGKIRYLNTEDENSRRL